MTDGVRLVVFCGAAILCVVAEILILRGVFAQRRLLSDAPSAVRQSSRGAEILWGILPAIALAILLAATWRVAH